MAADTGLSLYPIKNKKNAERINPNPIVSKDLLLIIGYFKYLRTALKLLTTPRSPPKPR